MVDRSPSPGRTAFALRRSLRLVGDLQTDPFGGGPCDHLCTAGLGRFSADSRRHRLCAFVVFAEIINSAIEALCDFVEARHNEKIKVIKDISAAAVGIAIFTWLVVMLIETGRLLDT